MKLNHSMEMPAVLVTGAAKRIGRDIAITLAKGGWRVAIHYNNSADDASVTLDKCKQFSPECTLVHGDLSSENQVHEIFQKSLQTFGRLDAIVNSASMFINDDPGIFSYQSLEQHMRVNVAAPLVFASLLNAHLAQRGATGCIVNLLDQKLWNTNPDFMSYSASKAALKYCVQMMSQLYAPILRVNAVAPGLSYPSYLQNPNDFERTVKYSLLNRATDPKDVATAVEFMLNNQSVTGSHLVVDAGQHLTAMGRDVSFL